MVATGQRPSRTTRNSKRDPKTTEIGIVASWLVGYDVPAIAKQFDTPEKKVDRIVKEYQRPTKMLPGMKGEVALANQLSVMFGRERMPAYNPSALVSRRGLRIFDKMRKDDQIKAALSFKKLACLTTGWEVVSPGEQNEDWELTRFVEYVLKHIEGSFDHCLLQILTSLDFGFSVSEMVFKDIVYGDFKGLVGFDSIKTVQPHTIEFKIDPHGNLYDDGMIQSVHGQELTLPRAKFIIHVHQMEFGNWYGMSDLEAAYRAWWIKENAYRWLAMLLERFGIPPIFALYNPLRYQEEQINALVRVIQSFQAATAGAMPRPDRDSLELWSPQLADQVSRVFIPALEFFNKDISRALLMPGLLGFTSDEAVGSMARSAVHFDAFMLIINHLRNQIADHVVMDQVVKPIVDFNYGPQDEYPIFRMLPFTDEVRTDLLTIWKDLLGAGAAKAQKKDEEHIRTLLKFPERDEDDLLDPPPAPGEPGSIDPATGMPVPPAAPPKLGPDGKPLPPDQQPQPQVGPDGKPVPPTEEEKDDGEDKRGEDTGDDDEAGDGGDEEEAAKGKRDGKGGSASRSSDSEDDDAVDDKKKEGDKKKAKDDKAKDEEEDTEEDEEDEDKKKKSTKKNVLLDDIRQVIRDELRGLVEQPREPAGKSTGGQFAPKGGGGGGSLTPTSGALAKDGLPKPKDVDAFAKQSKAIRDEQDVEDWQGKVNRLDPPAFYFGGGGAEMMNRALRRGAPMTKEWKGKVAGMDKAFDDYAVELPEDTTLYRGISGPAGAKLAGLKIGASFVDKGFASTTSHKDLAGQFRGGAAAVLKVRTGKGMKAILHDREMEAVLPRGRTFTVTDIRKVGSYTEVSVDVE